MNPIGSPRSRTMTERPMRRAAMASRDPENPEPITAMS